MLAYSDPLEKRGQNVDRIILNCLIGNNQKGTKIMNIVTVNELEKILKVSKKTLYQWAELGQIPSIKIQGCLRFDLDDVMKWVESCKKEPHDRVC